MRSWIVSQFEMTLLTPGLAPPDPIYFSGEAWELAVSRINGYYVKYTRRGSWKAYRRWRGKTVDEVPVAWDTDYYPGKPPTLFVWFEDITEAYARLKAGKPFVVALAEGLAGRDSSSSDKIYRLYEVAPVEVVPMPTERTRNGPRKWLRCTVIRDCPRPERMSDAPRP
jgi:hypothetical protein